jgi:hypothetical protein
VTTRFTFEVTVDRQKISIELPPKFFDELVGAFGVRSAGQMQSLAQTTAASVQIPMNRSEREMLSEKKPSGHSEIVAVLAYCLREAGAAEFSADDMRRAYIRAAVRPPKVVAQALRDAKNKYELIEGGSKKGTFRLSSHGERTVLFDLPRLK